MSTLPVPVEDDGPQDSPPLIDAEHGIRPLLTALGIEEVERGVCQDTYENRRALRRAKMTWIPVYATNGAPTGLIMARSEEMERGRRLLSLEQKKPILVDPDRPNSDYLTGLELVAESATDWLVPPWVVGATRAYLREQENGGPTSPRRQPLSQPHRCRHVKEDGIRCLLWSSGRPKDDGLCRVHLSSVKRQPGEDVARARAKLTQAAPYAVDVLEDLMTNASSEPVKLKASTEILDRAGVRGGIELDASVNVQHTQTPSEVVAERLARLARAAVDVAARLESAPVQTGTEPDGSDIFDGEVVEGEKE
jgi:hypothetical protein